MTWPRLTCPLPRTMRGQVVVGRGQVDAPEHAVVDHDPVAVAAAPSRPMTTSPSAAACTGVPQAAAKSQAGVQPPVVQDRVEPHAELRGDRRADRHAEEAAALGGGRVGRTAAGRPARGRRPPGRPLRAALARAASTACSRSDSACSRHLGCSRPSWPRPRGPRRPAGRPARRAGLGAAAACEPRLRGDGPLGLHLEAAIWACTATMWASWRAALGAHGGQVAQRASCSRLIVVHRDPGGEVVRRLRRAARRTGCPSPRRCPAGSSRGPGYRRRRACSRWPWRWRPAVGGLGLVGPGHGELGRDLLVVPLGRGQCGLRGGEGLRAAGIWAWVRCSAT